ncbi:MAG TPA: polysaccharide deacetylase family protein [Xanthobacteraceae bacterium]|nr:polysaccharide deacetylase family protein [Xanthobacteraceae bacterium]
MSSREFILNFHGIGEPHTGVAQDERPYWISESRFDEILDLVMHHPNGPDTVFTFDDGNVSDLSCAAPRLIERGREGRFFILTGRFDAPYYLSRDDTRCLHEMGMEIGLHGRDHVDWRRVSSAILAEETIAAREELAAVMNGSVTSVAIPFGAYNPAVIRHLRRCRFSRIYTSDGGATRVGATIANRTSIRSDTSLDDVCAILADRQPLIVSMRRLVSTQLRRHLIGR